MNCWRLPALGSLTQLTSIAFLPLPAPAMRVSSKHKRDRCAKWLDYPRACAASGRKPENRAADHRFYSDVRLLPYLQHSFWFCLLSLPAMRWRTCWLRNTIPTGM